MNKSVSSFVKIFFRLKSTCTLQFIIVPLAVYYTSSIGVAMFRFHWSKKKKKITDSRYDVIKLTFQSTNFSFYPHN